MSDINKQMAEFAKELWENYIKPKVGIEFSDTVSYYMATVVSNDGYNRVTIKRPFDDAYQVSCLDDMAGLEAGDTVLVLRFGNGTNNANHIVFGKGNGNMNYTAAAATATATEASVAASQAAEAAADAIESASQAADAADAAQQSALEAQESAETANQAANNALIGLATVEGVVDTVNWFAEHKTASTDTSVVPSKTYYEYNPVAGTLSAVTPEGDENPSEEGWYELSEAISNYVAAHIATTNDGLYVVGLSNGWKVLVSSGTGTYTAGIFLIDPSGNIAQATTANGITFDDSKPFYIGDNNASIVFDGNGHISISGIGVSIGNSGSKSIDEVLSELGASIKTIEYGVGNSATSHSDITSWSSNTPEWQEDKYIWQRTTTNGLTYTYTCIQGAAGAPGAPGVSVSGVTNYYLATSQSSGVTRETTGWTTSIQTMTSTNQYLWNYEVVTGSDGSTLNTTDPVIIGRYGQDGGSGRGITGITEYYLASNQQTGITPSSSGWTTTVQTTTTATPYLWNYEVVTYSSGSPETSSARIIGTHGATGADGRMLYATSTTAAGTAAKTATLANGTLTLTAGATVAVTFTNANTAANATLNVAGTGAKTIRAGGASLTATSEYNWTAGATAIFVYDGTYWQMDGTAALDKLGSLDIGGRNLSTGTGTAKAFTPTSGQTYFTPVGFYPVGDYGVSLIRGATTEDEWVVSFDYAVTGAATATQIYVSMNRTASSFTEVSPDKISVPVGNSSGHFSTVFQLTSEQITYGNKWLLSKTNNTDTAIRVTLSNFMFEKGNRASSWSPAPEDVEEAIEAVEDTATEALNKHGFCSCSTAASTAAKTASLTGFQLKTGSTVHVTFTNANSKASATLNINSTGAKTIKWNGQSLTATESPWAAGECVTFVYDGYYWVVSGQSNILADNIVAGSIATDRIKANVINAVNGGTGKINADKIYTEQITIGQSQVTGLPTALNGKEATVTSTTPTYDTDQIPYMYRRSTKAIMGQESLDAVVGGTVAWNQIIKKNTTSWYAYRGTMSYSSTDNEYTVTFNGQGAGGLYNQAITDNIPQGHKVLIFATVRASKNYSQFRIYCNNASKIYSLTTSDTRYETILATNEPNELHFYVLSPNPASGDTIVYKNIQLFDITLMFGSSIADYIYSLETATAGSGMEKLRQWGFFTDDVYEYAEETRSVTGLSSHDTVGKNLADLSKQTGGILNGNALTVNGNASDNYASAHIPIKLFKGVTYTFSAYVASIKSGSTARIAFRNISSGGTYVSSDALTSPGNLTVSYTPTTDLKVRLAFFATWGSKNAAAQVIYNSIQLEFGSSKTTYEPFNGHSYPLNSSVILRGTLKLVSNELQYDGDIYYPDGKVERAYNKYTATTCTSVGTTTAFGNYAVVTIFSDADAGSGVYTPLVCSKYLGVAASGDRAPMTAYIVGGSLVIVNPAFTSLSAAQSILAQQAPTIIYKKKTPTIETITPYQQTQMADANGTEKFVTTNTVPVGHCTTYPTNLRAAIDSLPVDTTDAARTATNYITNIDSGGITVSGNSASAKVQITNKVRVQADSTHFTDVESTGMKVYSGSSSVPVAQFLATGSRVSYDATHYTEFAANSWTICGGTNSPTITASTYPNTATEATTGLAGLTISNSARTKKLIQLFTYKRTYTGSNPESANITLHAYDTGNEVIGLKTTRLEDGSTAGGAIYIQGLGTTNTAVDMISSIGNLNGTQRAGGLLRVHYGTASVSVAAQLRTFGQSSAPSLEFYNTSGTLQSWYGANLAYIYREAGYAGYAAHGKSNAHKYTFEWSTIGSYNYLCFFVDTSEVYRLQQQSYSDERVKKDIEPIRSDYKDAVGAVDITQFRYDFDNETLKDADGIMFGIIAQDLIEELDDKGISYTDTPLVSDMGEGDESLYSVNYTQFLLARIAHDEDRIQKLEEQNHKLEEQNKALEERLSVLEDIMLKNLIRDIDET